MLLQLCGVLLAASLQAQPAAPPSIPLEQRIPFDVAVRTGTLPNGLTYYVRHNERPEKRVVLRLAVKAGSLDEADDQQGLAHMLEHMAFNGTTHFKPGELVAYFESTGSRLGPHVNAYTSFTETAYMLQLPTDREGLVEKGLVTLADFAGGMTLDPGEIDKERGIVLEEWRLGLGAGSRLRDKQIPVLYHQSRYAQRLPIGKPEVLRTFKPERLRAFYREHYRPDRMAVVVVGHVDVGKMEDAIRASFSALKNPAEPVPARDDAVPLHGETLVNVATDPEAQRSSVAIVRKFPANPEGRVADYRRDLVERLAVQMINDRLEDLAQRPDAKFLNAGASGGSLSAKVDSFNLGATVTDGGLQAGLTALAVEAERLRRFGFTSTELERAKKWMIASYERAYAERDKTESASFATEYISHFLIGEPSPGIEYELRMVRQFLPGTGAEETSAAMRRLLGEGSRVVLAVSPQKANLVVPTPAELLAALTAGEKAPVTAWTETETRRDLLPKAPVPGAVSDRRELPELGVTIVRFSNGVEAWLKPTDFKNDQVLFSMYARGGASLAPPELYPEAALSHVHVMLSGLAGLRAIDLPKVLAGRLATAGPSVSLSTHGISGSSTPADFPFALQLLYAAFTMPGDDNDAFALLKKQLEASVANRESSPTAAFSQRVSELTTSNHYTAKLLTTARISQLDRSAMVSYYRERFANAADFTLFVVGNVKVEEAIPLLAQYVGSLPSSGEATSGFKDVGIRFPTGVRREVVRKGREPKTQTLIAFEANPPMDEAEMTRLHAATTVLEISLRDILREDLGQTYTVSVAYSDARPQSGTGSVNISFGGAPENVDAMIERIFQEVKRLKEELPSADYVNRAKESSRRAHETSVRQNGYWLGALQSKHLQGRDPLLILGVPERVAAVTPEAVREMFRQYFPADRHLVVTLAPEP
ncbi:MAG TPA: insulinase family protein [Vicinamibacterales bacterium]|nr:insulinase family protein [Vicinamibacterales bacterium]